MSRTNGPFLFLGAWRLALGLCLGAAGAAVAQVAPQVTPPANSAIPSAAVAELLAALRLPEVLDIMRTEGLAYGESLESDLFPGRGGPAWTAAVEAAYSVERMTGALLPSLERQLGAWPAAQVAEARDFFRSDLGQRIVALENSARAAQLDEGVRAESRDEAKALRRTDPERDRLLRRFIAANDLVEANVIGALNANAAFYFGLAAAGAFDEPLSEEEVLGDVAAQEEDIRRETEDWIGGYLALAYRPLSDAELGRYLAFTEGRAGQALNQAMFAAYDGMFLGISRDLGRGAARFIAGQDL